MTSLSKNARVAGLLYILASMVGVVRLLYIPTILIVHGNATATANNIVAHESLFRLSIVSQLLASVLWLFVPLALYRLLKEVDHALARAHGRQGVALGVWLTSRGSIALEMIARCNPGGWPMFAWGWQTWDPAQRIEPFPEILRCIVCCGDGRAPLLEKREMPAPKGFAFEIYF